jgi:hypothetical protein
LKTLDKNYGLATPTGASPAIEINGLRCPTGQNRRLENVSDFRRLSNQKQAPPDPEISCAALSGGKGGAGEELYSVECSARQPMPVHSTDTTTLQDIATRIIARRHALPMTIAGVVIALSGIGCRP